MQSGRAQQGSRLYVGLLLGIAVGLAAAYGAWWLKGGDAANELAALTQKTARLESDLIEQRGLREAAEKRGDDAERRLRAIPPADTSFSAQASALQDRVTALLAELDAMTDRVAAENAARKSLEADLQRERESAASIREERDRLGRELAGFEAEARTAMERAESAERQNLQDQRQAAAADTASADSVARLQREIDLLKSETLPELNTRLAERETQNRQLTAEVEKSRTDAKTLQDSLQRSRNDAERAGVALRAAEARAVDLAAALEAEKGKVADTMESEPPPVAMPSTDVSPPSTAQLAPTPRDVRYIERVLAATPGVNGMATDRREQLRRDLIAGACVSTALETAFDRVPVVTLRNLIRDLKSDC